MWGGEGGEGVESNGREGGGDGGDVVGSGGCVVGCYGYEDVNREGWLVSEDELA